MNTQTHLLIAAALLAEPARPARNAAVVAGALVPDLAIYTLFVWSKFAGIEEMVVWRELYHAPPWQTAVTIGNSAPLYGALLAAGLLAAGLAAAGPRARLPVAQASARAAAADRARTRKGVSAAATGTHANRLEGAAGLIIAFALAALSHLAGDLPVHVDDAHAHFWPLSDWRFRSPVSYWDPRHAGDVMIWMEAALGLALALVLWRRFRAAWVRALLILAMIAFAGPPVYFGLVLGA